MGHSMPLRSHLLLSSLLVVGACARSRPAAPVAPEATPSHSRTSHTIAIAADGPHDDDTPPQTPPDDAIRTASGLAYVVLRAGSGTEHPPPGATIRAHYIGWTAVDGARFDDSYARGEPIAFVADHVIRGWGEAVGAMVVGERIRVWIPESLAYEGKPGLPAGTLVFDIELLEFEPAG